MGALDGILVVSLEQALAAPFCTVRLADAGARVIKIERAEGDFAREYDHVVHGESAYFVWVNRGKQSLVLDFKSPEDAALLARIIAKADVLVQNLAPGAAERAGFGAEAMRAANPRLITCDISGYGETGPYAQMKAYDLLIQCEAGLASVSGSPEGPGRVGVSIADIASGMYAHAAILEALYQRERTGVGKSVAVSMFDALADWMTVPLLHHDYGGRAPPRVGVSHPSIAPYGAFASQDGKQVVLGVQNEREWKALCAEVLGDARLAEDPRFVSNSLRVKNRV
ncbi:MAG TPA: CaiB/BaiF CoA-transferase family protein, partial [Caulobacteraceae bacterium]